MAEATHTISTSRREFGFGSLAALLGGTVIVTAPASAFESDPLLAAITRYNVIFALDDDQYGEAETKELGALRDVIEITAPVSMAGAIAALRYVRRTTEYLDPACGDILANVCLYLSSLGDGVPTQPQAGAVRPDKQRRIEMHYAAIKQLAGWGF